MKKTVSLFMAFLMPCLLSYRCKACSVLYYFDAKTSTPYVANNEDYWFDQKVVLRILPAKAGTYARLWYGWHRFAQGRVNENGLFFDGAVTPESAIPEGYGPPRGNLGDRILAKCKVVEDALKLLEDEKIALDNAHMMFGDSTGNAVVVEWVDARKRLIWIQDRKLIMTNFLLAKPELGGAPCPRYQSIEKNIEAFRHQDKEVTLLGVGNMLGAAVQVPRKTEDGRQAGTLYSTFMDLKNLKLVFVPKLDSSKAVKLDLRQEFSRSKARKIEL